jgi:U3 small nucleolar RNA-associated protein 6
MTELYAIDPCTCSCYIRQPTVGVDAASAEFPVALGSSLDRIKESMERTKDKVLLTKKTKAWIESILEVEDLDPDIQTVLRHTMRKLV